MSRLGFRVQKPFLATYRGATRRSRPRKRLLGCVIVFIATFSFSCDTNRTGAPRDGDVQNNANSPQSVSSESLRVLGSIPTFELTDQNNEPFGTDELRGKLWIANFMFTRCTATCPKQTATLKRLQDTLGRRDDWNDMRLVSITVDPEYDTAEVLSRYAETAGADGRRWKFLTGAKDRIWETISKQGFKLAVATDATGTNRIVHSSKFALVDPYLRLRGVYESGNDEEVRDLLEDIDTVMTERVMVPSGILKPDWLDERRDTQLESAESFKVFHDFSFEDRRAESGIAFRNKIVDDAGKTYKPVHYDHGNGIAIADIDGDQLLDIYFVTQAGPNELWRNKGAGKFENITELAGVAVEHRIGVTASFADIDNDGDPDLYVTTVRGGNLLFENNGDLTFRDISGSSGLNHVAHSSGAVFFDYDRDGLLDLFLANVGKYTGDEVRTVTMESVRGEKDARYPFYSGFEDAFAGQLKSNQRAERSLLFRNLGNNEFQDVSDDVDLVDIGWTGDATPVDFNRDQWMDLYVLNMQGDDQFYINREGQRFEKVSRHVFPKTPWGSMGVKAFDYDQDGDLDLYVTDMHSDMSEQIGPEREKQKSRMQWPQSFLLTEGTSIFGNAFYQNQGDGTFQEISDRLGAENYWPWGISVDDLNADGYDDVFVASSMNFPFRYGVNSILLNDRGQRFLDSEFVLAVEPRSGGLAAPWFELDLTATDHSPSVLEEVKANVPDFDELPDRIVVWSALGTRSSVIFDLENDGDLDIVTNEFNYYPMVLISNLADKRKDLTYLKVRLEGTRSNRSGLGAVVTVYTANQTQSKVYDGQSGYLSQSSYPLYFGLDGAPQVEKIEIVWPSGTAQTVEGPIRANQEITFAEADSE